MGRHSVNNIYIIIIIRVFTRILYHVINAFQQNKEGLYIICSIHILFGQIIESFFTYYIFFTIEFGTR